MSGNLPVKTFGDILALGPCYDPSRYLPEDWEGTALDILRVDAREGVLQARAMSE